MKTILVGTDFSEGSDKAFGKACEIAQSVGSAVHLLHVLEPVDDPGSTDPETQDFYAKLERASREKLESTMAQCASLECESSVRVGARYQVILEKAEELDADLIVLGSQPISQESRRIGTSHRVAMTSGRAVLLVP